MSSSFCGKRQTRIFRSALPIWSRDQRICSGLVVLVLNADLRQHAGMGLTGEDVVAVKAAAEADRPGEGSSSAVVGFVETASPGFFGHGKSFSH